MEWNYFAVDFTLPWILYYPGRFVGLGIPLIFVFVMRRGSIVCSAARAIFNQFLLLALGFLLVFAAQLVFSPDATATYSLWDLILFVALPLWGMVGFLYADRLDKARLLLGRFALCAALGSFSSFGLRLAEAHMSIPFGAAGWPMRLFFLFGFCWYLSWFLLVKGESFRILGGLFACSLEVVLTLHKPIIWASLFSIVTTLLIIGKRLPLREFAKIIMRLLKPVVAVLLVLAVVNSAYEGAVIGELNAFISDRVLHQSDETRDRLIERFAAGRIELWKSALSDVWESPWVGSGIKLVENEEDMVSLHNGYLDILFIVGICGFTLAFLGFWFWLKRVLSSLNHPSLLPMQLSCLAYVIGIMMFNAGGTSRLFPGVSYFVMLVCGVSLRLAVDCRWPTTLAFRPDDQRGKFDDENLMSA